MRKSVIAILTFGVLLTVAATRANDMRSWRAQILDDAEARADNVAFILSEYLRERFSAGDAALRQLALHSTRIGGPQAPPNAWAPSLASAFAGVTGLGSISVVDAEGLIRHSTLSQLVGQSRRDQYVFRQLSTQSDDALVVDQPLLTISEPKQFIIPVGRRLLKADGTFDGAVVATFTSVGPRALFQTVDVGTRGTIWVFHPEGMLLFREPSVANPIGEPATSNPIFAAAKAGSAKGALRGEITPGGPIAISAFRRSAAPPFIVAVSLDRAEVLQNWWRQRIRSAVYFVVLLVMMGVTLAILFRQMTAKTRAEETLRKAERHEAESLREANDRLARALAIERDALAESEAANAMKDEFLMTVSHELRSPITAIQGWVSILVNGQLSDTKRNEALNTIERNVRVQARLIDDLLDESRAIQGKLRLEPREVDLPAIISQAVDSIRPTAAAKRIEIAATIDPAIATISGDPERLQQVLWNLLSNAIKFTPLGGRVQVEATAAGTEAQISVTDTGAGMSADFLPHAFERFRQEEAGAKRRFGGLGLGLAIVRHLVELHGGSVTAESPGEGQGSTFRVRLPRAVSS